MQWSALTPRSLSGLKGWVTHCAATRGVHFNTFSLTSGTWGQVWKSVGTEWGARKVGLGTWPQNSWSMRTVTESFPSLEAPQVKTQIPDAVPLPQRPAVLLFLLGPRYPNFIPPVWAMLCRDRAVCTYKLHTPRSSSSNFYSFFFSCNMCYFFSLLYVSLSKLVFVASSNLLFLTN